MFKGLILWILVVVGMWLTITAVTMQQWKVALVFGALTIVAGLIAPMGKPDTKTRA